MEQARSLRFAEAARQIAVTSRREGWAVPSFRSPPGVAGAQRTVRRRGDGSFVVAVALRNRSWPAVLADMVEGVVVANQLEGAAALRCRHQLGCALAQDSSHPAAA